MHANPRHNREATEFHVKNGKKMRFKGTWKDSHGEEQDEWSGNRMEDKPIEEDPLLYRE
jgi:hypothetical protein